MGRRAPVTPTFVTRVPRAGEPPQSEWHARYHAYLASPEREAKRRGFLASANKSCQRCWRTGTLHVHHKHYQSLGSEQPDDVEVLCPECHKIADAERAAQSKAIRATAFALEVYGPNWRDFLAPSVIVGEFDRWLQEREEAP